MKTDGPFTFVDLCAGCGGLSLGLMSSGWEGLFGIEKDSHAFSTLEFNLINGKSPWYKWPAWLPKKPAGAGRYQDVRAQRGGVVGGSAS